MLKIILIFSISILFSFCNYENYIISTIEVKTIGKYELYSTHKIISSYEKFYEVNAQVKWIIVMILMIN